MFSTGIKFLFCLALLFPASAFAHLLSISTVFAFPDKVIPGSTHIATYRVTNIASQANVIVADQSELPSGLSIKSTTCSNAALAPNASCTIQVQLIAPLTPQTISTELREWAQPTVDSVQIPIEVIVTPSVFNTFAYVARNHANDVSLCSISASDNTLTGCNTIETLAAPASTAIFGKFLYIGFYFYTTDHSIELCNINPETGALSGCTTTGSGFDCPFAVAINPAGNFAYIGDIAIGTIFRCAIDLNNGTLSDCHASSTAFKKPIGITFSPQGNFAYIADLGTNTITVCVVDPQSGDLNSCHTTGNGFTNPGGIVLNVTGTFAYVVDGSSIFLCAVDTSDGNLSQCESTGNGFNSPSYMTLNTAGTRAYVTNFYDSTVSLCTVSPSTGVLNNCNTTGGAFSAPIGIGLY